MKLLRYITIVLVLASCNKVKLEPGTDSYAGAPVFTIQGMIGVDSTAFVVGENAELDTYHYVVGGRSFVGSSVVNAQGDTVIKLDFALSDLLSVNSFTQPIDIGSLDFHDTLDIQDVPNYATLMNHLWVVDGIGYQDLFPIPGPGEYNVTLLMQSAGEDYELEDKLVVGTEELYEPEIALQEVSPNMIVFNAVNVPAIVDSIAWFWHDGAVSSGYITNNGTPTYFSNGRHVLRCDFYAQGTLINYKSMMFQSGGNPIAPVMSIDSTLSAIEYASVYPTSRGKITVLYNGEIFTSKESYTGGSFQFTNLQTFIEDVTGDEYLNGDLMIDTYLFNQLGDSIPVFFSGTFGLQKNPD